MSNLSAKWSTTWSETDKARLAVTRLTTRLLNAKKLSLSRRVRIGNSLNRAKARLVAILLKES